MQYSDMIRKSFRSMRSGALWAFAVSATAARMLVMLVVLAAVYAVGAPWLSNAATGVGLGGRASTIAPQLGYFGAIMLGSILAIPFTLTLMGGLTHLSDEVIAGRDARTSSGWGVGAHRMGSVFAIQLAVAMVTFLVSIVCAIPLILASLAGGLAGAAGTRSGGQFNPVPLVAGVCCGYLIFLILLVLAVIFLSAIGAIAMRYAIIGQRTAGDALGSAFKAVRVVWKNVFVFAWIQFGFGVIWAVVMVIVALPVQIATGISQADPTLSHMLISYAINGPVTAFLAVPLLVFSYSMWTAFFRQMTGLDMVADPRPPMYAPAGYGYPSDSAGVEQNPRHLPYDTPSTADTERAIPMAPGAPGVPAPPAPDAQAPASAEAGTENPSPPAERT